MKLKAGRWKRGLVQKNNKSTDKTQEVGVEWGQGKISGLLVFAVVYLLSCVCLFCDPMDCSSPGSSVDGISQARILVWIAISSSRGSSWPRDLTHVSCIGRWILYHWAIEEVPSGVLKQHNRQCGDWVTVVNKRKEVSLLLPGFCLGGIEKSLLTMLGWQGRL